LVVAAGGGGDIVTSAVYASKLRRWGFRVSLAAYPWERFVVDRVPGPIDLGEIYSFRDRGKYYLTIDGSSYSIRGGRIVRFQAANVSLALNEPIDIYTLRGGVLGAYRGIREICRSRGVDLVVGLDVGGDILAKGNENDLWSPLADQVTLASLYLLWDRDGIHSYVAVAGPGVDGELSRNYIFELLSGFVRDGSYLGSIGFGKSDIKLFEDILKHSISEAGYMILEAVKGNYGWKNIRNGTRRVYLDILSTMVFHIDSRSVYKASPMAHKILATESIDEANQILLSMGVPTEYELENILSDLFRGSIDYGMIMEARRILLDRIRRENT